MAGLGPRVPCYDFPELAPTPRAHCCGLPSTPVTSRRETSTWHGWHPEPGWELSPMTHARGRSTQHCSNGVRARPRGETSPTLSSTWVPSSAALARSSVAPARCAGRVGLGTGLRAASHADPDGKLPIQAVFASSEVLCCGRWSGLALRHPLPPSRLEYLPSQPAKAAAISKAPLTGYSMMGSSCFHGAAPSVRDAGRR